MSEPTTMNAPSTVDQFRQKMDRVVELWRGQQMADEVQGEVQIWPELKPKMRELIDFVVAHSEELKDAFRE